MKHFLLKFLSIAILLIAFACGKDPFPGGDDSDLEPVPPDTSAAPDPDTATTKNFYFGANGHPLNQEAYAALPVKEQMRMLKNLGMNIYRVDFPVSLKGEIAMPKLFASLKAAADSAGITLLPMLPSTQLDYDGSEEIAYKRGFERAFGFASNHKNDFQYYNIANELDIACILPNKSGRETSHYDLKKFKIIAAHLKGMDEGIKAADSDAQTMVNTCWMHYKYLQMLETYGVNYDIVAYHWYSEMETLALDAYQITDITEFLSKQFSKPIWFTETNIRDKRGSVAGEVQRDFLNSMINKCKKNQQVKALIIYELLNQPVFGNQESYYGLYDWEQPYKKYKPKLWAAEQERKVVGL